VNGGLRERKKQATRQAISDTATGLFMVNGFDNTSVVEIAEAAGVSAQTVQNYFPAKADLFFDEDKWYLGPAQAVRAQCPAVAASTVVLNWYRSDVERRRRDGHLDNLALFIETIEGSETLRRRRLEDLARLTAELTAAIATTYPSRVPWQPHLTATLLTGAITVAESETARLSRQRSGTALVKQAQSAATRIFQRSLPDDIPPG
jgi:AcrR family transcriptional regulator